MRELYIIDLKHKRVTLNILKDEHQMSKENCTKQEDEILGWQKKTKLTLVVPWRP